MVAGTIFTAVGDEVLIDHPLGESRPAWSFIMLGGAALFLAGRVLVDVFVHGRLSWPRLAGLIAVIAVTPVVYEMPPLDVAAFINLILLGVVAWHAFNDRSPRATSILDSPL
jgi:low temperature requirement protein LtrA